MMQHSPVAPQLEHLRTSLSSMRAAVFGSLYALHQSRSEVETTYDMRGQGVAAPRQLGDPEQGTRGQGAFPKGNTPLKAQAVKGPRGEQSAYECQAAHQAAAAVREADEQVKAATQRVKASEEMARRYYEQAREALAQLDAMHAQLGAVEEEAIGWRRGFDQLRARLRHAVHSAPTTAEEAAAQTAAALQSVATAQERERALGAELPRWEAVVMHVQTQIDVLACARNEAMLKASKASDPPASTAEPAPAATPAVTACGNDATISTVLAAATPDEPQPSARRGVASVGTPATTSNPLSTRGALPATAPSAGPSASPNAEFTSHAALLLARVLRPVRVRCDELRYQKRMLVAQVARLEAALHAHRAASSSMTSQIVQLSAVLTGRQVDTTLSEASQTGSATLAKVRTPRRWRVATLALVAARRLIQMACFPGMFLGHPCVMGLRLPLVGGGATATPLTLAPAEAVRVSCRGVPDESYDDQAAVVQLIRSFDGCWDEDSGFAHSPRWLHRVRRGATTTSDLTDWEACKRAMAELRTLSSKAARSLREFKRRSEVAEQAAAEHIAQLKDHEHLNEELRSRVQALIDESMNKVTKSQVEVEVRAARSAAQAESSTALLSAQEKLSALEAEVSALRAAAARHASRAQRAEEEQGRLRERCDEADGERCQLDAVRAQLEVKEADCQTMVEFLRTKAQAMVTLQEERSTTLTKLRSAQTELNAMEKHAERMKGHATSLEAELDERRAKLAQAEAAAIAAGEEAERERMRAHKLQAVLVQVAPDSWHSLVKATMSPSSIGSHEGSPAISTTPWVAANDTATDLRYLVSPSASGHSHRRGSAPPAALASPPSDPSPWRREQDIQQSHAAPDLSPQVPQGYPAQHRRQPLPLDSSPSSLPQQELELRRQEIELRSTPGHAYTLPPSRQLPIILEAHPSTPLSEQTQTSRSPLSSSNCSRLHEPLPHPASNLQSQCDTVHNPGPPKNGNTPASSSCAPEASPSAFEDPAAASLKLELDTFKAHRVPSANDHARCNSLCFISAPPAVSGPEYRQQHADLQFQHSPRQIHGAPQNQRTPISSSCASDPSLGQIKDPAAASQNLGTFTSCRVLSVNEDARFESVCCSSAPPAVAGPLYRQPRAFSPSAQSSPFEPRSPMAEEKAAAGCLDEEASPGLQPEFTHEPSLDSLGCDGDLSWCSSLDASATPSRRLSARVLLPCD